MSCSERSLLISLCVLYYGWQLDCCLMPTTRRSASLTALWFTAHTPSNIHFTSLSQVQSASAHFSFTPTLPVYSSKAAGEAHSTKEDSVVLSTILPSDKKRAEKFSVLINFFKGFTCVCLWMHMCAFYRCWRLKCLGYVESIEHRCVRSLATLWYLSISQVRSYRQAELILRAIMTQYALLERKRFWKRKKKNMTRHAVLLPLLWLWFKKVSMGALAH